MPFENSKRVDVHKENVNFKLKFCQKKKISRKVKKNTATIFQLGENSMTRKINLFVSFDATKRF